MALGILTATIVTLSGMGIFLNSVIPFSLLTEVFKFLRYILDPLNYIWNIDNVIFLTGLYFSWLVVVWLFKAGVWVRSFLTNKNVGNTADDNQ